MLNKLKSRLGIVGLSLLMLFSAVAPFVPAHQAYATATVLPQPMARFFTAAGAPLAGGKVYTYTAGTTTPLASYTDSTALVQNTNPVILDSTGSASIWISGAYKVVLKDSTDVTQWTQDNVQDLFTYNQIQSTSTTSLSIANSASKTFTTQAGKYFSPGIYVLAVETSAPTTNWMHGQITSYSGTQLVITTDAIAGTGSYADWTISLSGPIGPAGPTGPTGSGAGDMTGATNLAQGVGGVASTVTARANLGLGSAATKDVGTSANQVVQLNASAKLPAVDGSLLTNLPVQTGTNPVKAWVRFNFATATIIGSSNVSSITKNSTGDMTINFTTPIASANYAVSGATDTSSNTLLQVVLATTNSLEVRAKGSNFGGNADVTDQSVIVTYF